MSNIPLPGRTQDIDQQQLLVAAFLPLACFLSLTGAVQFSSIMDVANLEAAFERVTVTDENDDQISSSTTYHKSKVPHPFLHSRDDI